MIPCLEKQLSAVRPGANVIGCPAKGVRTLLERSPIVGLGIETLLGCEDLCPVFVGAEVAEPLLDACGVLPLQVLG